jgi:hypothetical protein
MHQGLHGARDEAVVDEEVFLDLQAGIAAFEIAGTITGDAMP